MTPSRESSSDREDERRPSLLDPDQPDDDRPSTQFPRRVSSVSTSSGKRATCPERTQKIVPNAVEEVPDEEYREPLLSRRDLDRTTISSVLAAFFATVPFIAIVGVLLYLINANRVGREKLSLPDLHLPTDTSDSDAILVNFSATQLTTLASWASNVATLVPGLLMTLYSCRVASYLLRQSELGQVEQLLTPYQLSLLLETLDAKLMSLWTGCSYFFWKGRLRASKVLRLPVALLFAALTLSGFIWAADTWLHVTVSTVIFSKTSRSTTTPQMYGLHLPDACKGSFVDVYINDASTEGCQFDSSDADAYQILVNSSSSHQVLTGTQNGTRFSYLAPVSSRPDLDFVTSTIAVGSSCQPTGQDCKLASTSNPQVHGSEGHWWDSSSVTFNCSADFYGNITLMTDEDRPQKQYEYNLTRSCLHNSAACLEFFTDNHFNNSLARATDASYDATWPLNTSTNRYANPFYAGALGSAAFNDDSHQWIQGSPEIMQIDPSSTPSEYWFVLSCGMTAYYLTYAWVNNTMISGNLTLADDDVANVLRTKAAASSDTTALEYSSQLVVAQSSSLDEMAANYALELEKLMLAFSADLWTPTPNLQEQTRHNMIVTRVPKAPLFTLIVLCLIFVLLGVAVTILASRGQTPQTREVQARLNVFGVVASRFESEERNEAPVAKLENVFEERDGRSRSTRIGVARSRKGGWKYTSSLEQEGNE